MNPHEFCRFQLSFLRRELKAKKIKVPKIDILGVYVTMNNKTVEDCVSCCNYSKRSNAICRYLEENNIEIFDEEEK